MQAARDAEAARTEESQGSGSTLVQPEFMDGHQSPQRPMVPRARRHMQQQQQ